jgi:hypothetical protein
LLFATSDCDSLVLLLVAGMAGRGIVVDEHYFLGGAVPCCDDDMACALPNGSRITVRMVANYARLQVSAM